MYLPVGLQCPGNPDITIKHHDMRIKGMSGEEYNVTGQGQGNYNTVGASAGIASFLGLNAGNILGGGCGRNGGYNGPVEVITTEDRPVSRYEAGMMDKLAAKDSEIALLKSNTYTDQKLADVYDRLLTIINRNKEDQNAINLNQAVYNGTNTATLSCMKQQIAELAALSELVIPQRKVCDTGCCGCNN